ncbi:MAG TPA: type IX secretion system membrane protein PorP/SprF [Cytophagaceae bacterium]|nr:type IX secretion system membrane protein PorP/SprF [Cytophagaceae bacterium]
MYKIIFIFLTLITFLNDSYAQQDAQFSQYMFNGLYYNPGYAGIEGVTRGTVITRRQWLGYKNSDGYNSPGGNSPTSQAIMVNSRLPFLKSRTGAGLGIVYDNYGPITSYEIQLSGAYHVKIGDGLLGIGGRAGTYAQSLKGDWYQVVDTQDPIYTSLVNNNSKQLKLDYAAGLWYQATKWYVGASINHLSRQKFSYNVTNISSVINNHMYFTGGYIFTLSNTLKVTPTAMVQTDLKQYTILVGPMVDYNSKFWVGLNARQSAGKKDVVSGGNSVWSVNDMIGYAGVNLMKNNALKVGFAFDFVLSGHKGTAGTSHEIMLSYMVPSPGGVPKPKVRTPRYRHDEN